MGGACFFAARHRVGPNERIGGGEPAGGELDGGFDAPGIGDHGAGREPRGDGAKGLLRGIDRRRHDDQISTAHALGRIGAYFRHAEAA